MVIFEPTIEWILSTLWKFKIVAYWLDVFSSKFIKIVIYSWDTRLKLNRVYVILFIEPKIPFLNSIYFQQQLYLDQSVRKYDLR